MALENSLSTYDRPARLANLKNNKFDLLVIGGGATGAGVALDAAARGLRVGLLEMQDYAEGTSSRSTKLIHGGLRYLKQGALNIVREVGLERAILHKNAPHLVLPENLLLPIRTDGSLGRMSTNLALWLYDRLAGVRADERRDMLSIEETTDAEPLLNQDGLEGGAIYKEYRTDDARLVMDVLKTATTFGAICVNYLKVEAFLYKNGQITGVSATDRLTNEVLKLKADVIVNAAGPWSDKVREKDAEISGKRLHLTKGVHLVVPNDRLPLKQSVYFDISDGRMMFAIPRNEVTYFGTTDTNYDGEIGHPMVNREDAVYLLDAVNEMFPTAKLTFDDVQSSWAGLRPLIHEDGKDPSELSRKDEIFYAEAGLITITGGKLTGFRKMAERVVDKVVDRLEKFGKTDFADCSTEDIALAGGAFASREAVLDFCDQLTTAYSGRLSYDQIRTLIRRYGRLAVHLLERFDDPFEGEISVFHRRVLAELNYCIKFEGVAGLSDFLIRRTGMLYFERDKIDDTLLNILCARLKRKLKWDDAECKRQRDRFNQFYLEAVAFKDA